MPNAAGLWARRAFFSHASRGLWDPPPAIKEEEERGTQKARPRNPVFRCSGSENNPESIGKKNGHGGAVARGGPAAPMNAANGVGALPLACAR